MLRRLKRIFIFIIIILIGFAGFLAWFFINTDAPVIHGKIIWHQPYKEDLKLDVYLPTQLKYEKTPVVVYFHGGAWLGGNKATVNLNRFNKAFNRLRENGYAIISPEYTLATRDKPPFPDCIIDAYMSLQWIRRNADEYNFDLENIGVFGESARAHIAMMLAYAEEDNFGLDDSGIDLRYVVDVYGPSDLNELYNSSLVDSLRTYLQRLPEKLEDRLDVTHYLFGFDPEEDTAKRKEYATLYSPISYINRSVPPTLIIHGKLDQIVPIEQSKSLKILLDSNQVENDFHLLRGMDHAFRGASKQQKDSVQSWVVDFIEEKYH